MKHEPLDLTFVVYFVELTLTFTKMFATIQIHRNPQQKRGVSFGRLSL